MSVQAYSEFQQGRALTVALLAASLVFVSMKIVPHAVAAGAVIGSMLLANVKHLQRVVLR